MQIYLVRHGHSKDQQPGETDTERDLTEKGRGQANALAAWLLRHDIAPAQLYCSPLNRAVQTAEPLASALNLDLNTDERLSGGKIDPEALKDLLIGAGEPDSIMLVGHEPDCSEMIRALTGAFVHMSKAAIALVTTNDVLAPYGELECLVPPDLRD
ncbi:MAG: SixA phosphatase family protein [Armatimonadota bacterium]